jgi:hypothetical protein
MLRDQQTSQSHFLSDEQKAGGATYFDLETLPRQMIRKSAAVAYLRTNPSWYASWLAARAIPEAQQQAAADFVVDLLCSRMSVIWCNIVSTVNNPRKRPRLDDDGQACDCGKPKMWICVDCELVPSHCPSPYGQVEDAKSYADASMQMVDSDCPTDPRRSCIPSEEPISDEEDLGYEDEEEEELDDQYHLDLFQD